MKAIHPSSHAIQWECPLVVRSLVGCPSLDLGSILMGHILEVQWNLSDHQEWEKDIQGTSMDPLSTGDLMDHQEDLMDHYPVDQKECYQEVQKDIQVELRDHRGAQKVPMG